ncbi:MAG TPA: DUF5686 family protein [Bacteroidales bacterium]|nr:DUF5686 family protein [Bacteroidales bacterium]
MISVFTRYVFIFLLGVLINQASYGQLTKIMGSVVNKETGEPMPYVNIIFNDRAIGITSDFDGKYSIETKNPGDSLIATFIGFEKEIIIVEKGKFQIINFEMIPHEFELQPVVIVAGENPAEILLKKIIENKPNNNPDKFDAYEYEAYNKIQVDISNVSTKMKEWKIFRSFEFIFDYVDTSSVNGKTYLPVFLSETLSNLYFRKNPRSSLEKIQATKMSGIDNESISKFLGDKFQNTNVYDNYILLFEKNFISPIADFGLNYYRYYLIDSAYHDNKWCYKVMFKPRRKQTLTFTGNYWVHDTTFAIKDIELKIADDANINYINDFFISKTYNLIEDKYWLLVKDYAIGDFNLIENNDKVVGFFGRKTTTYSNYLINQPRPDDFYKSPVSIVIDKNDSKRPDVFWLKNRHEELTPDERTIYFMVDTLKTLPRFKTYIDILQMIAMGYYEKGLFEYGPYASLFSYNEIEGVRFRIGGRTSNDFSAKVRFSGHLAYGLKDEKFKYGLSGLYMIDKNPRKALGINYIKDLQQLGTSQNAFREDFFMAFLFRRNPADKLSLLEETKINYEHEWFNGFQNTLNFIVQNISSPTNTAFQFYFRNDTIETFKAQNVLTTTEIRLDTRLAYQEKIMMGDFKRISLGAKYPILELRYSYGIPKLFKADFEYHKLQLGISHWFNIMDLGWSKYIIEAGRFWGKLPYPLLKLHEGNETFFFDEYSNNTMNYFEFVSNKYLSAYYTHHFDGYFFNRVPLFRKLKWREVIWGRAIVGGLDHKNRNYSIFPKGMYTLNKPFFEVGAGVENILKVIRFDAVWRLSYLDHADIQKFGLLLSLQFQF